MNVDDNVICKKELTIRSMTHDIIGKLVPDNLYNVVILDESDDVIWITIDDLNQPFNINNSEYSPWKFNDYFYTEKEIRNIKLNKLKTVKNE